MGSKLGPSLTGVQSRRDFLAVAGKLGIVVTLVPASANATPEQVTAEIKKFYADKPMADGKIKLDLPTIAENGLVVPLNFEVESPMTATDYVKAVHFFADSNPNPNIASFYYTADVPKASAQIRIRLAQTQNIVAIAEMSDGKLYKTSKEVKVTIGGCGG